MAQSAAIVREQTARRGEGARAPCELPSCKLGLRSFPGCVLFSPVMDGHRGRPKRRRSHAFPVVVVWLTGKGSGVRLCPVPAFFLYFTGKQRRRMDNAVARDP